MPFRIFGPRVGPRRVDAALRAASTLPGPNQMQSHKTHLVLYDVVRFSDFFGVVESGGPHFLASRLAGTICLDLSVSQMCSIVLVLDSKYGSNTCHDAYPDATHRSSRIFEPRFARPEDCSRVQANTKHNEIIGHHTMLEDVPAVCRFV